MAGDWIKMRGNLWDDPRVSALVDATDSTEAAVIGSLYWLWATADQHTEDGVMPGLTISRIDRKTGLTGFGAALVAINWIEDHPDGIHIVDFESHNGVSAKKRCQTAKRVATFKAGNAEVTQTALPKEPDGVSDALARERERVEKEKKDAVAKATDGDAVLTKKELWVSGRSLLAEQGMPKEQCGSFIGKLAKDFGDVVTVDAVRSCVVKRPADAAEYLIATCKHLAGERKKPDVMRVTVPGRIGRDPELIKADNDQKNRAAMPEGFKEMVEKTRLGLTP